MPPLRPILTRYQMTYTYTARLSDGTLKSASTCGVVEAEEESQARSKLRHMLEALGHQDITIETVEALPEQS